MALSPRVTAVLAFAALLPFGVYAASSGEMTTTIIIVTLVDVLLVASSIVLMFGPSPDEISGGTPS
jgi:hypothetical protein